MVELLCGMLNGYIKLTPQLKKALFRATPIQNVPELKLSYHKWQVLQRNYCLDQRMPESPGVTQI